MSCLDYPSFTTTIAELSGLGIAGADPDSRLSRDLEFDSLALIQLIAHIEDLARATEVGDLPMLVTLGDAYGYYVELQAASTSRIGAR